MHALPFFRLAPVFAAALALGLASCSPTGGLAPGLVARMDATGAKLDTTAAFGLINHLRASRGAPALSRDPALEVAAQEAANAYLSGGRSPQKPDAAGAIMTSAGYMTFAETFSGWRGVETDTRVLADPGLRSAGLAVAASGSSEFGTYWVLLMAP
jgi:uncharacterized protein YkwD